MCKVLSETQQEQAAQPGGGAAATCPECGVERPGAACWVCGRVQELAPNRGQFTEGNDAALRHGAYSMQRAQLQAPLRLEMRAAVLRDAGHTDSDVPIVLSVVADQFVEARLIASAYFEYLVATGGPISTKGRQRRAVDGYFRASAAVERLARTLGLTRRAKDVTLSPQAWLAADIDQDPAEQGTPAARPTREIL